MNTSFKTALVTTTFMALSAASSSVLAQPHVAARTYELEPIMIVARREPVMPAHVEMRHISLPRIEIVGHVTRVAPLMAAVAPATLR